MTATPASAAALCILCATLTGCGGGRTTSPFANLDPQAARELAHQIESTRAQVLEADLREAFAIHAPRNILLLSGGDADGAFGCGVLAGWRNAANPAERRPTFDVVTGVSTGALMATFAFLGEPRDDAQLRDVYTHLRDQDVMDGPFGPGPPNSVFDTTPLKRLIAHHVTDESIHRVAEAHRAGRRLYVATVELDSGSAVIWPLSKIASDAVSPGDGAAVNPAGVERFRQVLLAAASIPVLFPPVQIDGGLHVDAGIREAIFLRQAMLGFRKAYDDSQSNHQDPPTVWAIVNAKLRSSPEPVADNLLHIGVRSLTLYTESLQVFNLRDAAHLAAAHNPPFNFRWLSEPDELDAAPTAGLLGSMFDPNVTVKLYKAGEILAQYKHAPWHDGAPKLDEDPDAP
ncbi:MAG: patatin [Phycisphaerales bacterium]|nr:patatin [Phycisphaerales bacterium]